MRDGDAIEAAVAVDGRLDTRLADHQDARVGEDVAQFVGHLGTAPGRAQPAGGVVAEEPEPRPRDQFDFEARTAVERTERVAPQAEQHEMIGDEPLEKAAHAVRALGAVREHPARVVHMGVRLGDRRQHPRVVFGDVAYLLHRVTQRGFEVGEMRGIVDARRHLDVERRLARRAGRRVDAQQRPRNVAADRQDRVQEEPLAKLGAAQQQSHRVYDEGPVVLEDLDHGATRTLGRVRDAHEDLADRARGRECKTGRGGARESALAHTAGARFPAQVGAGEGDEAGKIRRCDRFGSRRDHAIEVETRFGHAAQPSSAASPSLWPAERRRR